MVAGAPVKVAAGAVQEISPVEVAADVYPAKIKTQRQMAGQMTSSVWHLLTPVVPPMSVGRANQICRLWRRELHKVGAKAACVDAAALYVDVAGITLTRWQDWMRDTQY